MSLQTKTHLLWLSAVTKKTYGDRCQDFEKNCHLCRAWEFYDEIEMYTDPRCDYLGTCKHNAFCEVYPSLIDRRRRGWSYLCRKHFLSEQSRLKKLGKQLPWVEVDRVLDTGKKSFEDAPKIAKAMK